MLMIYYVIPSIIHFLLLLALAALGWVLRLLVLAYLFRLLPLPADEFAGGDEAYSEIEYEPSPEEVFEALIPQYISGTVYGTLIQSCASEHCSRRAAMHNATENAGEILDDLNTDFHRARQESVTGEIIDIATAAMGVGHEDRK